MRRIKSLLLLVLLGGCLLAGHAQCRKTRTIALTLDDGPAGELTESFLELFEHYDVKVTFFHIGKKSIQQTDLCKEILERGHEIGNHSWSHQRLTTLDTADARMEIERFQQFFRDSLAYRPVSFRPPFLKHNPYIDAISQKNGLTIITADIYARDAKMNVDPEVVVENLSREIPDGSIILCHERPYTLKALKVLLPVWKKKGYRLVTVSQIIR
ncbi:polysaccharide deacetylase family protein [Marinilabiliaceae bacterium JC017]|nr:polysaccharide deacetylase family protein [Marinilabiliaceae bacterium JC017]